MYSVLIGGVNYWKNDLDVDFANLISVSSMLSMVNVFLYKSASSVIPPRDFRSTIRNFQIHQTSVERYRD